ncbi:MAG: hypothetical protein LAT58_11535 [Opitutales bacterium]|nr:hypothetical protein [Opitutales bacterium]
MNPFWKSLALVLVVALVVGILARPVEEPAWQWVRDQEPALQLESLEDLLGQGIVVGVMGGFRSIFANLLWIRGSEYWKERDLPGMQTMIRLVIAIDPRPSFFWMNGARITSLDMPHWRIREQGGRQNVPEVVQERIFEEQNLAGIEILERAMIYHPEDPQYPLEIGLILARRMDDLEGALVYYRKASEMPRAPAYAARTYAQILRRLGRDEEAYEWLASIYPTLDPNNIRDRAEMMLRRIRELEEDLEIPPEERIPELP